MIRQARKATTAAKRAAFEFQAPNKKPDIAPGLYSVRAAKALRNAPVANRNTPNHYFEESRYEIIG